MPRVSSFRNGAWVGCVVKVFKEVKALISARVGRRCTTAECSLQKEMGMNVVDLMSSESSEGVSGWDFGLVTVFFLMHAITLLPKTSVTLFTPAGSTSGVKVDP